MTLAAAHVSPGSTRRILRELATACSEAYPAVKVELDREVSAWEARHRRYLELCAGYRARLHALTTDASAPPEERERFQAVEAMMLKMMDDGVAAQVKVFTTPIESLRGSGQPEAGERLCRDYAASVKDGKWELKHNDPALVAFFEKQGSAKRPKAGGAAR